MIKQIILFLFFFSVFCFSAQAAERKQILTYEVYGGGFNAVLAKLNMEEASSDRYRTKLYAKTKGFLGSMFPWYGTFETNGWHINNKKRQPETHIVSSTWRGETEIKEYAYNKSGEFKALRITEEGKDKSPDSIDMALTKDTIDALTATLNVMEFVSKGQKCEGESLIFDGKRRFKLLFKDKGKKHLEASKYNIFEGEATECVVEIEPKGGRWHKKPRGWLSLQEQGRKYGALPTIWLASVGKDKAFVPVKVRLKTQFGTLFAHLTQYENEDGLVKQASYNKKS